MARGGVRFTLPLSPVGNSPLPVAGRVCSGPGRRVRCPARGGHRVPRPTGSTGPTGPVGPVGRPARLVRWSRPAGPSGCGGRALRAAGCAGAGRRGGRGRPGPAGTASSPPPRPLAKQTRPRSAACPRPAPRRAAGPAPPAPRSRPPRTRPPPGRLSAPVHGACGPRWGHNPAPHGTAPAQLPGGHGLRSRITTAATAAAVMSPARRVPRRTPPPADVDPPRPQRRRHRGQPGGPRGQVGQPGRGPPGQRQRGSDLITEVIQPPVITGRLRGRGAAAVQIGDGLQFHQLLPGALPLRRADHPDQLILGERRHPGSPGLVQEHAQHRARVQQIQRPTRREPPPPRTSTGPAVGEPHPERLRRPRPRRRLLLAEVLLRDRARHTRQPRILPIGVAAVRVEVLRRSYPS